MPAASRIRDLSTGHEGFPPTAVISTPVTKTRINGKLAAVVDAELVKHSRGKTVHFPSRNRKISQGSSKVNIEGKPAARIGDSIDCGDTMGQGSSNTYIGG
jgi:uncharacterized Zn-binding protein involved in type VI secretion